MLKIRLFLIVLVSMSGLSLFSGVTYAAIDLFDSNRGKKTAADKTKPVKPSANNRAKALDLMFVGMSQMDKTTLYFRNKKKVQIKLQFESGEKVLLPGYEDLIIERVENRVVYLKDTNGLYCKDNVKSGIYCRPEDGYIEMRLVRSKAIAPKTKKKKAVVSRQKKALGNKRIK